MEVGEWIPVSSMDEVPKSSRPLLVSVNMQDLEKDIYYVMYRDNKWRIADGVHDFNIMSYVVAYCKPKPYDRATEIQCNFVYTYVDADTKLMHLEKRIEELEKTIQKNRVW